MGLQDCGMPEEKLPQCWSDDVRMNALFAPFRLKSANPESWEMKMKFWSDMVRQWCKHKKDPIVNAADVKCVYQRKGRTAVCIDIVIEEMFRNGELCPLSKYQQILHNGPEGWVKWGAKLAFRPAAFALTAVTSFLPKREVTDSNGLPKASIDSTQRFVLESAVRDQATELINNFPPGVERIGTIDDLMRKTGNTNREAFEVWLGYLVSQGLAVKKDDVVKLAEGSKKVSPITSMDESLVKLCNAETRLEEDATRLAREVAAAAAEASAAMKLGNRLAAKNHLRKKLKAQQRLDRCEAALENVRQLLVQARNTDVNTAVIDTYRTSANAMKENMKQNGLDEDSVFNTMDDLKEVMESYNEVSKALGGGAEEFDAAELEQELSELMAGPGAPGGTPQQERPAREPVLPSPPREAPRKTLEREFVFDGEEQMLAELNNLGVDEASPRRVAVAVADEPAPKPAAKTKPSQPWYPPSGECLRPEWGRGLDEYGEVRQDERIHPGQPLNVDYSSPARHYSSEFAVRDHRADGRVWFYSSGDEMQPTTHHTSEEGAGQAGGNFQMAPGGERKKPEPWPKEDDVDDLERRLKNLRGYK
ncbi:charged multivesicular body protein 7 isoform X2 [Aricia agestis]|uniref:charged multivesicular body protein 7 isoform X2 n=1 Tax=Aricia agestis TaxID=91739 RepID=UPI001C20553B|nr:charged multivesicular body protein 7 isoform X2 [Aricia agestis]